MDFRVAIMFKMDLTGDEFRLVSKALRGKLRPEDVQAAEALQVKMLKERHHAYEQMFNESQKAMDNIARGDDL